MDASTFWATGDYGLVGDLWSSPGRDVVASLSVAGRDAIDLATGTGVTAIGLAVHGAASVVGVDITPQLLFEAARRATDAGVQIRWLEADVEHVPLPSESADLVTSTFGLVFAADPARAVEEARRLVRQGGEVVLTSWSPHGVFGDIRRVMAAYFPEAPEPWHESVEGIRTVVGPEAAVDQWEFELVIDSPEAFVDLMERYSAPIVIAAQALGVRWPEARRDLVAAVESATERVGSTSRAMVPYWVTRLTV